MSYIRDDTVKRLGIPIQPNNQTAQLADEITRMKSLGEIDCVIYTTEKICLRLRALVLSQIGADCYGGLTFHKDNHLVADIVEGTVTCHGGKYTLHLERDQRTSGPSYPPPSLTAGPSDRGQLAAGLLNALMTMTTKSASQLREETPVPVKVEQKTEQKTDQKGETINIASIGRVLPLESYPIPLHKTVEAEKVAIIPQFTHIETDGGGDWVPQVCEVRKGQAMYSNTSKVQPMVHPKGVYFRALPVEEVSIKRRTNVRNTALRMNEREPMERPRSGVDLIKLDEHLPNHVKQRLVKIHQEHSRVFNEDLSGGFSGFEASINFNKMSRPPPHKLWVPQFNMKCQSLLQAKCDELERQGVLADPITHGITVTDVSPSFVQQKGRAKHKKLEECSLGNSGLFHASIC